MCFRVFIDLYIVLLYDNQYSDYGYFRIFVTFSFFCFLKTVERLSKVCTLFYRFKPKDDLIIIIFLSTFFKGTIHLKTVNIITGTLYLQNLQGHLEDLSYTTLENTKKF